MNILLCGANGFIGRHLEQMLITAGHRVVRGVRTAGSCADISIDYVRDTTPETWLPRLAGIDAVINAVGILSERGSATFNALHREAPIALFEACMQAGVKRVIQISALSGSEDRLTPYLRSKREADSHLMNLPLDWVVLRPSLIVGADGESSRVFRSLASLPVIALPGRGEQRLQPVHIDDVCAAIVNCLTASAPLGRVIDCVGPNPLTYRDMLAQYRRAMGLKEAVWRPIPMPLIRSAARVAYVLPQKLLSTDTLRMLEQGNTSDPSAFISLVGQPLKDARSWFADIPTDLIRAEAVWLWLRPLFRLALAIVWIVTGLLSLGIYPVEESYALLAQVGLHGSLASIALYGAALLDLALGIATLAYPGRRLWRLQMALMTGYTIIISFFLPEFWLHPFGPILKNIPILALLIALDAMEGK